MLKKNKRTSFCRSGSGFIHRRSPLWYMCDRGFAFKGQVSRTRLHWLDCAWVHACCWSSLRLFHSTSVLTKKEFPNSSVWPAGTSRALLLFLADLAKRLAARVVCYLVKRSGGSASSNPSITRSSVGPLVYRMVPCFRVSVPSVVTDWGWCSVFFYIEVLSSELFSVYDTMSSTLTLNNYVA